MAVDSSTIRENLLRISGRIAQAATRAGRSPDNVQLVAVTKAVGIEEILCLIDLGQTHFGENRLHVAAPKIEAIDSRNLVWHMIGNVQRRKAGDIAALFDAVDAIDRLEVAEALEKRCAERNKPLRVLIEVNVSGEEAKHGFSPDEVPQALERISALEHLTVDGLMTMAPFVADPEETRPVFEGLRQLAKAHGLRELSMGMSNDYEVAIEEGATQVRIGTALFV